MLPSVVTISSPAAAADMIEGRGGTFECVVTGGNPRPVVTWLINNNKHTAVEYVSRILIYNGGKQNSSFLVLGS